ncbi:MAG: hypothetical protein US63_C0008G0008 [Candidatus Moranbacteria bacterium GW2011_GWC2_37_8]|nr:MAG: hypothetical protein US63_C0008G0008 [Candidatus Moranbacteria bacterium GW2011_GWC2_37_8]KKQ62389.1 MAG: hypothetical protein US82_C0012G0007 [Parcubacteria group bacterium GW2011_GWC1_38_22]KKQ79513.1 MAG: hypothetical protein UT03_C0051G0005 [Candidatus Moranbacteria bacterium GW2011_GWD2_38_7]
MDNILKDKFVGKFDLVKFGFNDVTPYTDGSIGVSARKVFNPNKNDHVIQISFYLSDSELESSKRKVISHATYGKISRDGEGITIRSKNKLTDPVDISNYDDYSFDIVTGELYRKNKKISADELVAEVYSDHMKSTKPLKGLFLRFRMFFWRMFMNWIFEGFSKVFYFLFYLISGDRYSYAPFFETETLNGTIIKSRIENIEAKEETKKAKKMKFLSYEADYWPIIFYSVMHAFLYLFFMYKSYKPVVIITVFKNNFLTIVYVILSLWIIEILLPKLFKFLIRFFATVSFRFQYKSIKI